MLIKFMSVKEKVTRSEQSHQEYKKNSLTTKTKFIFNHAGVHESSLIGADLNLS